MCKKCSDTGSVLTPEAENWLSASGHDQAKMQKPSDHDRFVPCKCRSWEELDKLSVFSALREMAQVVYDNACKKGFHDGDVVVGDHCSNLHGEVSELWEAYRLDRLRKPCDKNTPEPLTCAEEELADILIRVLDISCDLGIDIARAVRVKHMYNTNRPYKHGNKKA